MEFNQLFSPKIVISIISITVLIFLFRIFKTVKAQTGKPPEAKGAWPIIGHLPLLAGSEPPHKVLGNLANKYGPIFTIKLGVHQTLVVSDAEMAKECLATNDKTFAGRPKAVAAELMGYNYAVFGLATYGEYWRQLRKIINRELLSQPRLHMLGHIRVSEVKSSIRDIYEAWVRGNLGTVQVEMKQWFGSLILNIIVRMISGNRFSPSDQEGVRIQEVVMKYNELLGVFMLADAIPYLGFLDVGGYKKAMKNTGAEMDNIFQGWLDEHKKQRESEESHMFMDVMISILQNASEEDFAGFDPDTVIKGTCLAILIGALDTTHVTLKWALSLLLNHPEALKIAKDELDKHVGKERLVEESDIKNLRYLQAIIKETLRLYPAAPLSFTHESMEDCIVGGYKVPKGTRLLVNLYKMHRDPNVWSDPYNFRPERFLTTQKDMDVKGQHFELLPFSSGRRICPGISFALQALHFTIASLIQAFEIEKPSKDPIDMDENMGSPNIKTTSLEVILTPRLSHNMYHVDA